MNELTVFLSDNRSLIIAISALIVLIIVIIIIVRLKTPVYKRIESRIKHRDYISIEDFFESWKKDKSDFPGCYVVLIYDRKLVINPMNYDDIYIGQSVNVRKRVFNHLKGHGNGDVYYGLKSGCKVYIVIEKCRKKKLNSAEKELISYYHATESLNMTSGGALKR